MVVLYDQKDNRHKTTVNYRSYQFDTFQIKSVNYVMHVMVTLNKDEHHSPYPH
jgi:hypothetical protein